MNIEIIAGSPRNPSLSLRVATYLYHHLSASGSDTIGLINLQEWKLPFIEHVWSRPDMAPAAFSALADRMFSADAFLLCSPEYNGGYSPALKNLFDHFPKQRRKAFGICTSSDGKLGGIRAAQQLLQLVPALFGIASPYLLIVPEADTKFDAAGNLTANDFYKNTEDFITEFLWLARTVAGK